MRRHWQYTRLEELCDFVIGGDWGKDPNQDHPDFVEVLCIRGSEFREWAKEKGKTAVLRKIAASSLEKRKLRDGDILVEISGGGPDQPVGRTVFIDKETLAYESRIPKVCTNFLRLVRLIDLVDKKFVSHYLTYFYNTGEIVNYQGGSNNLRNLRFSEYVNIRIPLPPLPEQHLIVAKLDTLFAHVDRLKVRLEKIPILLKQFRQSVLTQAVTGKLTEEWRGRKEIVAWEESRIGDLFLVETGATPKRGDPKYYQNGSIAFIKSGLVKNELIYNSDEFITEVAIKETNAKIFPIDTLLVAMYGEGKTRGQVGWLKLEGATNQAIAALVSDELPLITKSFVFYFCLSQYNEIRSKAEGGNQPNLNLSKIKNWEIKMPSLHEQHEIVCRVESLFAIADRIEAGYKTLKKETDQLPQAILAKAFRGELVRSDVERKLKEYEEMGDGLSMAAEG